MFAARRLTTALPRASAQRALFHNTRAAFVKAGDPLPDLDVLVEGSPGNKVNLAKEFKGANGIIVGTPAAFSTCPTRSFHSVGYYCFGETQPANAGSRKDPAKVFGNNSASDTPYG